MSVLMALAWALVVWGRTPDASFSNPLAAARRAAASTAPQLLGRLAGDLPPTAAVCRSLLLGHRDPREGSCVPDVRTLNDAGVPMTYINADGGPGSSLPHLMLSHSVASHRQEYDWEQTALRGWLHELRGRNAAPYAAAVQLAHVARALADVLSASKTWPEGLAGEVVTASDHWLGACLQNLNVAVAAQDLPAARRWANELASAAFALADLHRWVDFIAANGLDWLDFQVRCRELFDWTDEAFRHHGLPFTAMDFVDRLPGTTLIVPATDNLREVERQAEGLFQVLPAFARATEGPPPTPGALAMPPDLRETFTFVRSKLSPPDQQTWDRAAGEAFHRSYLANMLYRATRADVVAELALALRRLGEELDRPATVEELMSVAFYRGGETCGGLVWSDRFDSRLVDAAGRIDGPNEQALLRAHVMTNQFLGGWKNYAGSVWTLKEALDQQKFDCVRGTDMIGSLYRNAGNAGYRVVRLMWGLAGHSVSGCRTTREGGPAIRLADSLVKPGENDFWPAAYFQGHDWPEGYPGPRGPLYAGELCVRGLDNYLFAEGYVIRGPPAGTLARARIPYQADYDTASAEKVYAGPYPAMPQASLSQMARNRTGSSAVLAD